MNIANITFKPLPHSPSVMCGQIPVKPGVRLSLSYGSHGADWGYVGERESCQCAIQVNDAKATGYWDMITLPCGDNVQYDCGEAEIKYLLEFAKGVEMLYNVWVFDTPSRAPKRWLYRFTITNTKDDEASKLYWCNTVWKKDGYRTLPLGVIPLMSEECGEE